MTKRITDISGLTHLWHWENLYLAGQPDESALTQLSERGVTKVINIRGENEEDFSFEKNKCASLALDYSHIPVMGQEGLDAKACAEISKKVNTDENILIHCKSANRVGAWLITYLVSERGIDFEKACEIASESGLSNFGFIDEAQRVLGSKG